ncbi:MAG: TetR family transcriptional regulator [Mobiluncus porci]|uniref:TetR/AcrR family transcriptional regulator n=1 Tax=Mobiluncus porci TaxID=2652278 RepID=UPI0023F3EB35|nr:TetR family transcriptional regulator [Mobiluncus porci]MDD7541362.1 TetR family transcriptional regulator [Mobiluncus porci]MDY5747845.1 TetR family transcriptional regulator [Mobiluncus porci]
MADGSKVSKNQRGPAGKRGETRQRILEAAHAAFTEMDYQHATFREISSRAEVDPALIAYYFKSKAQLLRESLALPEDPKKLIAAALVEGPAEETGHRLAAVILNTWEQAATAGTLSTLFTLLLEDASTQQVFACYIENEVLATVKQDLGIDLVLPIELMMSAVLGMLLSRYVVKLEPLASMSREDLIDVLGSIIQRLLGQLETVQ